MRLKYFIFYILIISPLFATASTPGRFPRDQSDIKIYQTLLEEFPAELRDFDQTKESKAIVQEFQDDWSAYLKDRKPIPEKWFRGHTWSKDLSAFLNPMEVSTRPVNKKMLQSVRVQSDLTEAHSIEDPRLYGIQRIGNTIVSELARSKVKTIVYAGDNDSVAAALGFKISSLYFLPSPYEAWGIRKAFVDSGAFADKKPRFLMLLPPSRQYLRHYAQMFQYLGVEVESVILNLGDQRRQVARLQKVFFDLRNQLPHAVDVVTLGYFDQFKKSSDDLKILTGEIAIGEGLTVQLVEERKNFQAIRYLLIKSDLTIWGESTAFVVQAALSLDPKAVLFMGSAGGINTKTSVYDLSIPSEFVLKGQLLPIQNEIYESLSQLQEPPSGVLLGARHGHTNSPIEQTKAFVSQRIKAGVDSYDVEQNLIAETLISYNKKYGKKIMFGAINLITDKPKSFQHNWTHEFDLSSINFSMKSQAREKAVLLATRGFRNSSDIKRDFLKVKCAAVFSYAP